jgi:hypothetical protein
LLREIAVLAQKLGEEKLLKSLFKDRDRDFEIEEYQRKITACAQSFQIAALIDLTEWQHRYESAAAADRAALSTKLNELSKDHGRLWAMLGEYS